MFRNFIRKLKIWKRLFINQKFEAIFKLAKYSKLRQIPCPDEMQILKDIKRTKMANLTDPKIQNDYQNAIKSILIAYSNFRPEIGYVQGMNMSVSCILFNVCPDFAEIHKCEEDAFKLFVTLMDFTQIGEYYKHNMQTISLLINELKERVQISLPQIYWHIILTDVF